MTIATVTNATIENVEIFIEKNRIVIPARFRCVVDQLTNYKDV